MINIKNKNKRFILSLVVIFIFFLYMIGGFSISKGSAKGSFDKLFVMYAGSLTKIFEDDIGPTFQSETGYQYIGEGKGSLQIANLIKDGFRTPDVFVSAGKIPITMLMNNTPPLTEWSLSFGSAELVIAYSQNSPYYEDLEKARKNGVPWYDIVSEKDFKFGRTDPELDPKGYYAIIAAKLSGIYYNDSSIQSRTFGEDRNPKQVFPEETLKTILETGQVDAIVAYKHEAISMGLSYITLPKEINLGDPRYLDFYKKANYTTESSKKTIYGEPILFSVTIPKKVKNLDGATAFVKFILSKDGIKILKNQGLNPLNITIDGNINKMPLSIKNVIYR